MAISEQDIRRSGEYIMPRERERWRVPQLRREVGSKLANMGFFLEEFRVCQDLSMWSAVIEALVVCPCGGIEGIRFVLGDQTPPERVVDDLIVHFRHHIETEVQEGKLSPAWLERL